MKPFGDVNCYARQMTRQGARNYLLVLPSVICSTVVCERIADEVEGAVTVTHPHGCSQVGQDSEQTFRTLKGFAENPNVGAVLVVSLGCEVVDATRLKREVEAIGKPVQHIGIQDVGGSIQAIKYGINAARKLKAVIAQRPRVAIEMSDLCVAIKWGEGATGFSGHGEYVQQFVDEILSNGGTVILGETEKILKMQKDKLILSNKQQQKLIHLAANSSTSLINVAEQSLDIHSEQTSDVNYPNLSKHVVQDILSYGEVPATPGLYIMDSPVNDAECLTGYAAAGANLVLFLTVKGSSVGDPVVPVVKISTGNSKAWEDHVDFRLPSSFDSESFNTFTQFIGDVFDGQLTKAELLGHQEFAIHRIGLSL